MTLDDERCHDGVLDEYDYDDDCNDTHRLFKYALIGALIGALVGGIVVGYYEEKVKVPAAFDAGYKSFEQHIIILRYAPDGYSNETCDGDCDNSTVISEEIANPYDTVGSWWFDHFNTSSDAIDTVEDA